MVTKEQREQREQRIQLAIRAFQNGEVFSFNQACHLFNVPRTTALARMNGTPTAQQRQQTMQRLSVEEEQSLVHAIYQFMNWGWPMSISLLETLARNLLTAKGDTSPLGHNWYSNFLARYPDLCTKWSRCMDQGCKDVGDLTTLERWFQLFKQICVEKGIAGEDIYNMDEKGFLKGIGDNAKVIIPRSKADATSVQPGNREWVSVIEAIGANGYSAPPFVIFQGKRIQQSWLDVPQLDKRTVIRVSDNGWTDRGIAIEWLQHFDKYTAPQTRGKFRLLILDGHNSHTSLEFVRYCEDHNIIPLCLPPHSTHILQPLDIKIFGPLAHRYKTLIREHSLFGAERITNEQFLSLFQQARQTICGNIASAFRAAGLIPFNPSVVLSQFRPKTPPTAIFRNEDGVTVEIQASDPSLANTINELVAQLQSMHSTPQPGSEEEED